MCGTLLWFLYAASTTWFYDAHDSRELQNRLTEFVAQSLNVPIEDLLENPQFLNDLRLDSIDLVELMMEWEGGSEPS